MAEPLKRLFTVPEYHSMADAGILSEDDRVELIEGEIYRMAPIGSRHAGCVKRLNRLLSRGLRDRVLLGIQDPILLDGYSEEEVTDLLAKAPPAGLSIRVSRAAVNRFRKRYEKQERRRNSVNFMREFKRLLEAADGDDQAFLHASERLLKMRLFQITGDPNSNLETIAKLTGVITSLRKQALAERKSTTRNPNPIQPNRLNPHDD